MDEAADERDAPAKRHTVDAFHRGRFHLVQTAGQGHRAGMDAMVLAAAVPSGFNGVLADLGAGSGGAGLAVASRCPGCRVVLVERAPEMAECARLTLALEQNAALAGRADIIKADVTATGRDRAAQGLLDSSFEFVIMNPPFNAAGDRASPDGLRRQAHVMEAGHVEAWLRTAAAILRPKGGLAAIARPRALAALLAAMEGRFGDTRIVPIHPRPDRPAIRIVLRARRAARGEVSIAPPLVLHEAEGNEFTQRASAIINGNATLFGD